MSDSNNRYLIVGPAWVGDMVMAQSLFIDIKSREPNAVIDVLGESQFQDVSRQQLEHIQHGLTLCEERFRILSLAVNGEIDHPLLDLHDVIESLKDNYTMKTQSDTHQTIVTGEAPPSTDERPPIELF